MNFIDACKEVRKGKTVRREGWLNLDYVLQKDEDGNFTKSVSPHDCLMDDWMVVDEDVYFLNKASEFQDRYTKSEHQELRDFLKDVWQYFYGLS